VARIVKVGGAANSKIPSIFDHVVRNSSTIKSYYQKTQQRHDQPGRTHILLSVLAGEELRIEHFGIGAGPG
jgi:hypothetical protein